jgi:Primase C terminal 2 (PriCT-2)
MLRSLDVIGKSSRYKPIGYADYRDIGFALRDCDVKAEGWSHWLEFTRRFCNDQAGSLKIMRQVWRTNDGRYRGRPITLSTLFHMAIDRQPPPPRSPKMIALLDELTADLKPKGIAS